MSQDTGQPASQPNLSKFPNAEKVNNAESASLPSAFNLFTPSVNAIKLNLIAFLVIVGLPMVLSIIGEGPGLFQPEQASANPFTAQEGFYGFVGFVGAVLMLLFGPGTIILQLKSARKEVIEYGAAIKEGLKYFWRFLGLVILTGLILLASLALLIIPFFFVLPRIILAGYYLIDRDMGIVESLKASAADYKAHKGVWGIIGVALLMALASVIPFIGWIISNTLLFLYNAAAGIRYEQIALLGKGKPPVTPIESSATTHA